MRVCGRGFAEGMKVRLVCELGRCPSVVVCCDEGLAVEYGGVLMGVLTMYASPHACGLTCHICLSRSDTATSASQQCRLWVSLFYNLVPVLRNSAIASSRLPKTCSAIRSCLLDMLS